jgi:hypothetical protein
MKTNLLSTAAAVLSLALSPVAFAQTTVTGPTTDAAVANSQSGAVSGSVGVNDNSNGGVTVGPTTVGPIDASSRTTSDSTSGAVSGSISRSEGGAGGASDAHAVVNGVSSNSSSQGGNSAATTGASTATSTANPNANNQGNAQNITFNQTTPTHQKVETNPQVYAPALTTTLTETCMGSTSGGVSVLGFGGTLGTTWNDAQCVRRLNAREMAQTLGDRDAARALLCQDKDVARAYASVGQSCNARTVVATYVGPPPPGPAPTVLAAPPAPPTAKMEPIPNPPEEKTPRGDGERGGN